MEIDSGLRSLRTLCKESRNTRKPTRLSPKNLLEVVIYSIIDSQVKLTNMHDYIFMVFKYYRNGLNKNKLRDLNIMKQELMILFIDPKIGL